MLTSIRKVVSRVCIVLFNRWSYMEFYKDYSFFLKEGIVTSTDQYEKEEIARLLRFECSSLPAGETVSLIQ